MAFSFEPSENDTRHRCQARRSGDWAIFTCPLCPGFERRLNLRDGTMQVKSAGDPYILHEGIYVPPGLEQSHSLPN